MRSSRDAYDRKYASQDNSFRERMNTGHISALLAIFLYACGGSGLTEVKVEMQDVTLTFFRSFPVGSYVFRNQTELENAWATAPFASYPVGIVIEEPPIPAYDYSKYTVVGLSRGIGKWCFKPSITAAFSNGTDLVVHYDVSTTSTLACLRDGPLISFSLVPRVQGTVEFMQDGG
jgi:hypothetical protein